MLFHSVSAPEGGATYVEQLSCALEGGFNSDAFKKAWQLLIERHSVLRTYFLWEGLSEPVQVVADRADVYWTEQDWRKKDGLSQQSSWQNFLGSGSPPTI